MPNAIDLLRADHERLRQLLPMLADDAIASDKRRELLGEIEKDIKLHSLVEEEVFYPAYKDAASSREAIDMYYESLEEHHVVDMLLPELLPLDPTSDAFRAKAKVLRELFEHHAKEEEEDMFRKAAEMIGAAALQDLGDRMQRRKIELDRQWDSFVAGTLRRAQAVADKFLPSSVKDARVERHRDEER
ncbi:MAG TPA: hemerythrin domain-containing protein [Thermoanaerobaculia bacterium]